MKNIFVTLSSNLESLDVHVPDIYGNMPLDLYLVGCLFSEQSIGNPKVFNATIKQLPKIAKKYKLNIGGTLYRGTPENCEPDTNHSIEMLPGLKAVSYTASLDHAKAFAGSKGKVVKANISNNEVVININALAEYLHEHYPVFHNRKCMDYEDEVLVSVG